MPKRPKERAQQRRHLFRLDVKNPPASLHAQTGSPLNAFSSRPSAGAPFPSTATPLHLPRTHSAPVRAYTPMLPMHSMAYSRSSTSASRALTRRVSAAPGSTKIFTPQPDTPVDPLHVVQAGQSYEISHMARLPNDDFIRPSTLDGTKTPLRVLHELIVEVRFLPLTRPGGSVKVLKVTRPITISSVSGNEWRLQGVCFFY